jgi:hypothetical protein
MPRRTMYTPPEYALARAYGRLTGIDAAIGQVDAYFTARDRTGDAVIWHDLNVLLNTLRASPAVRKSVTTNRSTRGTIDTPT